MKRITAIVLAAGKSKRMKTETSKVLHKLQGKPVISHVYAALKKAGVRKAITVCSKDNIGAVHKVAEKAGLVSVCVIQRQQKGTADAVKAALSRCKDRSGQIIVTAGDMPLIRSATYLKLIRKAAASKLDCTLLTGKVDDPFGYGRIIRKGSQVLGIKEQKDLEAKEESIKEINSGVYVFRLSSLRKFIGRIKNRNRQKEYYLTDIISLFRESGLKVSSSSAGDPKEIQGINTRKDLSLLMKTLWDWKNVDLMQKGVTIEDPATTYIDMDVVIGRDTIIKPYSVIEGGTRIGRKCVIGPFSHIRYLAWIQDTAEIGNFVEVKKSIVKPGAKAKHLTYLGDATVGQKVNIGAGTITANFDGKNKFETLIGDECYIGSNTVLIAPLKLGKGVKTGSGAIVTRGQNIPARSLLVGVPAKIIKKM